MRGQGALTELLGHPLVIAALGAAFALIAGYLVGSNDTTNRLNQLSERMTKVEMKQASGEQDAVCSLRSIDRLLDKTGVQAPCGR